MAFLSPSPMELAVILVIALLVLGPSRLPETARSIGRGWRELRESLQGDDDPRHAQVRPDDPGALPVDPAYVDDPPYDDELPAETADPAGQAQPDR